MHYQEIVEDGLELINLTPHVIHVLDTDFVAKASSANRLLRIKKTNDLKRHVLNCPIYEATEEVYGPVPSYDKKKIYIVSQRVAEAMAIDEEHKHRYDFVYPVQIEHEQVYTPMKDKYGVKVKDSRGEPIMAKQQKIRGCRGFEFPRRPKVI